MGSSDRKYLPLFFLFFLTLRLSRYFYRPSFSRSPPLSRRFTLFFYKGLPGLTTTKISFSMLANNNAQQQVGISPVGLVGNLTTSAAYVYPATAFPNNTVVSPISKRVIDAGETVNITIQLKDFYFNSLVSSNSAACGGTASPDRSNYLELYYLPGSPAACLDNYNVFLSTNLSGYFTNPQFSGPQVALLPLPGDVF